VYRVTVEKILLLRAKHLSVSFRSYPFGMISPQCFSFHSVITIRPVPGQRVFRWAKPATRFYSRSRETMKFLQPVCARFCGLRRAVKSHPGAEVRFLFAPAANCCNRSTAKQRKLLVCDILARNFYAVARVKWR